ncbi:hypothetical protein JM93_00999 [Roseibium hamelinense]|uniref:Uncharacterized protein n=1 Tax=Roseibium hamelinense TaxID=150831 RepID=A0A562T9R1_9HYPH|nr:hypothetical protein JM93_00999 [Roseibium hamelinense]
MDPMVKPWDDAVYVDGPRHLLLHPPHVMRDLPASRALGHRHRHTHCRHPRLDRGSIPRWLHPISRACGAGTEWIPWSSHGMTRCLLMGRATYSSVLPHLMRDLPASRALAHRHRHSLSTTSDVIPASCGDPLAAEGRDRDPSLRPVADPNCSLAGAGQWIRSLPISASWGGG